MRVDPAFLKRLNLISRELKSLMSESYALKLDADSKESIQEQIEDAMACVMDLIEDLEDENRN
jgi:hypothetical protein